MAIPGIARACELNRVLRLVPAASIVQRSANQLMIGTLEIHGFDHAGSHDPVHPDARPRKLKVSRSLSPADPHNNHSDPAIAICRIGDLMHRPPAMRCCARWVMPQLHGDSLRT